MANTNLAEGHLKTATGVTYQSDGLRDTDVLTSPTLTNFVERSLFNGVLPITLNKYSDTARNDPTAGNCAVAPSGTLGSTSSITVQGGTVVLDGMFYTVAQTTYNVGTNTANLDSTHSSTAISNPSGANEEAIMLVYIDPSKPNNIGLIYGSFVDTGSGLYPSAPSAHLNQQSVVLAALRMGKGASTSTVEGVEDKRAFVRAGPMPLTSLIHSDGSHSNPRNDHIAGFNAGNLPITDVGFLFARDPNGFHGGHVQGANQTHLFFQSDTGLDRTTGGGGVYQVTPIHRVSKAVIAYSAGPATINYGSPPPGGIMFKPLESEDDVSKFLIDIHAYQNVAGTTHHIRLIQGTDYTVGGSNISVTDIATTYGGSAGPHVNFLEITYTHAGHQ